MATKRQRRVVRIVVTYLICLLALFFFISPMLWVTYSSFRSTDAIFSGKIGTPVGQFTLSNYATVLSVTDFPKYFWNSLRIGVLVTVLSMALSIIGAYGLSRYPIRGRNAYIMGVFSTQMFPVVLLLIPIYTVLFALRLFNTIARGGLRAAHARAAFCRVDAEGLFRQPPKGHRRLRAHRRVQSLADPRTGCPAHGRARSLGGGLLRVCRLLGGLPRGVRHIAEPDHGNGHPCAPEARKRAHPALGTGGRGHRADHRADHPAFLIRADASC